MKFEMITSPLDGDFDPVAQFEWQVEQGLIDPQPDYDVQENLAENTRLIKAIERLEIELDEASENEEPEDFVEIFDRFDAEFVLCKTFTKESSDALCRFIDILIKYNETFHEIEDELDLRERIVINYLEFFVKPQIPRPALWHLMNKYMEVDNPIHLGRDYENYMGYVFAENPLSGDALLLEAISRKADQSEDPVDIPLLGTNALFWNPSVTISTLERLAAWYISDLRDYGSSLDFLKYESETETFDFDFDELGDDFEVSENEDVHLSIVEFAILVARVLDELKLGRLSISRLASSKSRDFRTIAFNWPDLDHEFKEEAEALGVYELNSEAMEFLEKAVSNPCISAISDSLRFRQLK
jgi:hypothetical protein